MILNEDQRSLVATSLRVAAETYTKNASQFESGHWIKDTFEKQAADANTLAALFDNADSIEVIESK